MQQARPPTKSGKSQGQGHRAHCGEGASRVKAARRKSGGPSPNTLPCLCLCWNLNGSRMGPPLLAAHGLPSLPEPEERKETEPRAEALLTSKADTGQEQAPGPRGLSPSQAPPLTRCVSPGMFSPLCASVCCLLNGLITIPDYIK